MKTFEELRADYMAAARRRMVAVQEERDAEQIWLRKRTEALEAVQAECDARSALCLEPLRAAGIE